MKKIILASQSPQRKLMMETFGLDFEIQPADLDEKNILADTQVERAAKIALAKAEVVSKKFPESIVLAGDTYIVMDGQALEKPESLEEARQMLRQQSGQVLQALTGVAYIDPNFPEPEFKTVVTEVAFRVLRSDEIENYVTTQPVKTWSAAFSPAYPAGAALVESTNGSFTSFSHGFPIEFFEPLLQKSGCFPVSHK